MKALGLPAALTGAFMAAGCAAEYLDRRETVSFGAGDAQQANLVTHVVSPLPSHAADRDFWFHGERMGDAVERYRTGEGGGPAPGAQPVPSGAAEIPGGAAAQ